MQPSPDTLRTARKRLDLTQEQAARLAFVSLRAWIKYESGERAIPRPTWALFRVLAGITALGQLRREIH
jgi:transcriptional regulator with XRE-family HTH domain